MRLILLLFLLNIANTVSAQVFMPPFENAANLAMGGASTAWQQPLNGMTNPAQLANAPQMGILAYSALPYGIVGWQSHGFQAMKRVQQRSGIALEVLHSGIEGYAEQRLQLSYGRQLSEKLALGGNIIGMRVAADEYGSRNAVSFAVGITARPLSTVQLGAMVQNPIPQKIDTFTISNILKIGTAWQPSQAFVVSVDMSKDLERPVQLRAGIEYRPNATVRLRVGARNAPSRMALGAGFVLKNGLRIDFASEWHPVLGLTPAGMVGWVIQ